MATNLCNLVMIIQLKDNINYLQLNPRNWFIRYCNVEYMYINKSKTSKLYEQEWRS